MPRGFQIVGLGEALFDVFPDRAILGGAPLNVAYHAHQLCLPTGGAGLVASAVGTDALGQRLLGELQERGLTTEFVQVDAEHPTGRVDVALASGEPSYTFLSDVAWDHLAWTSKWNALASRCDAVVFGTLAQRSPTSRTVIQSFLESARTAIRLFDVNLRVNFFDAATIQQSAQRATIIKLNEEELPVVLRLLDESEATERHGAETLLHQFTPFGLQAVVLTRGSQGTELHTRDGVIRAAVPQFARQSNADNVGAGDACSAGILWGWLNGWPHDQTVALANRLGAFTASQPGATPAWPPDLLTS